MRPMASDLPRPSTNFCITGSSTMECSLRLVLALCLFPRLRLHSHHTFSGHCTASLHPRDHPHPNCEIPFTLISHPHPPHLTPALHSYLTLDSNFTSSSPFLQHPTEELRGGLDNLRRPQFPAKCFLTLVGCSQVLLFAINSLLAPDPSLHPQILLPLSAQLRISSLHHINFCFVFSF